MKFFKVYCNSLKFKFLEIKVLKKEIYHPYFIKVFYKLGAAHEAMYIVPIRLGVNNYLPKLIKAALKCLPTGPGCQIIAWFETIENCTFITAEMWSMSC